jgi:hypothetical protein
MRIALSLLVLLTAACSTTECRRCNDADARTASIFIDTDLDGLPDARGHDSGDPDDRRGRRLGFLDTDGDGLPDGRRREVVFIDTDDDGLLDARRIRVRGHVVRPRRNRGRNDRIERALQKLDVAIAELRRAMR